MFSSRFHWDLRPNRLTELLHAKQRQGAEILDLTESNPTHAGFSYPADIVNSLSDARALRYDPSPTGSHEARAAVAAHYRERGDHVDAHRILLTASTSEAYAYLFKLLTDPGDEVLVPRPSYPLFEFLASMESAAVRPYPLLYHGRWSIDLHAVERAITLRTRAIVVVNPNNPTGSYLKREELNRLVALCRERRLALISDEVFSDYEFAQDAQRQPTLCNVTGCLAFSLSGLSKAAGLPQMKLGWIVVSGPETVCAEALEKLEWIADTYLSVGAPVQHAASALLQAGHAVRRQIAGRTADNLNWLRQQVAGTAAGVLHVEGGWYGIIQMPRLRSEEEWALQLLDRHNVLVQPGFFYDFESEAFVVVSLLTKKPVFCNGIRRLLSAI